jgi:hypothetical protein
MEIAGFESGQYFASVVSDLNQEELLQLARGLAPALNETLHTTARLLPPHATHEMGETWLDASLACDVDVTEMALEAVDLSRRHGIC